MPYTMHMWVSSALFQPAFGPPIGAAAVVVQHNNGVLETYTAIIPHNPPTTPERAALAAIILALEQAAAKQPSQMFSEEEMLITIYTSSVYAHHRMTSWIQAEIDPRCLDAVRAYSNGVGGTGNGGQGEEEAGHRDLMEHAVNLQGQVEQR